MSVARLLACLMLTAPAFAQNSLALPLEQVSPEPTDPPARDVQDSRDRLVFHLPPGWNFTRHDGELSTFALDARSALEKTQLQGVAALAFNPLPASTFSGALFYVSVTPASTVLACANQATAPKSHMASSVDLDGVIFKHGYAEHGGSCIESRDEVYTALRGTSCLRFDLVINTFCGGEVSGARDMTPSQLESVTRRLEGVLKSVRFLSFPPSSGERRNVR